MNIQKVTSTDIYDILIRLDLRGNGIAVFPTTYPSLIPTDCYSRHDLCKRNVVLLIRSSIKGLHGLKGMALLTTILCDDIRLAMKGWTESRTSKKHHSSGQTGWTNHQKYSKFRIIELILTL